MGRYYIPRKDADLEAAIKRAYVNMDLYLDKKQWHMVMASRNEYLALVDARDTRLLNASRKGMTEHPSIKRAIEGPS